MSNVAVALIVGLVIGMFLYPLVFAVVGLIESGWSYVRWFIVERPREKSAERRYALAQKRDAAQLADQIRRDFGDNIPVPKPGEFVVSRARRLG